MDVVSDPKQSMAAEALQRFAAGLDNCTGRFHAASYSSLLYGGQFRNFSSWGCNIRADAIEVHIADGRSRPDLRLGRYGALEYDERSSAGCPERPDDCI